MVSLKGVDFMYMNYISNFKKAVYSIIHLYDILEKTKL